MRCFGEERSARLHLSREKAHSSLVRHVIAVAYFVRIAGLRALEFFLLENLELLFYLFTKF